MENKYVDKLIPFFGNHPLKNRQDLIRVYGFTQEDNDYLINYEMSLLKSFVGGVFNTLDIEGSGTYDFQFEVGEVQTIKYNQSYYPVSNQIENNVIRIYIHIFPGGLVDIRGEETVDVNLDLINNSDYGLEVESEIKDIFYDFFISKVPFFESSKSYNIWELYIIYPED
jgi:hypothetical protein